MYNFIKSGSIILLLFLLATALFLTFPSCDDNPTDNENIKSPREYTWTADTVYNPDNFQTLMSSIWGSSENDVYMCGHSSGPLGGLWHFDGNKWGILDMNEYVGSRSLYTAVHGTSWKNVWVVGYSGNSNARYYLDIFNYDGLYWHKYELDVDMRPFSVYSVSSNDVWICGTDGIVGHFNGSEWEMDTLDNPHSEYENFHLKNITLSKDNIYIQSSIYSTSLPSEYYYIFKGNINDWEVLDLMTPNISAYKFGIYNLYYSSFGELYSIGPSLFRYKSNRSWAMELTPQITWFTSMMDFGKNNIILVGNGEVYHNNGKNWEEIENLRITDFSFIYEDVWMNDKAVFIVGNLGNKSIVLKGN